MKVYALHGTSGTGKSHKASKVARMLKAQAIIDDGLLISENKVIAGSSAKREATKMASVKRALFFSDEHVSQVKKALKEHKIKSVLVIGTSEEMCRRIANRLGLDEFSKIVSIFDVSTPEEIELANKMRMTEGRHVIPVPTFEIKKDFSGYFLHPLRIFKIKHGKRESELYDKTVVRPTYSYLGDYFISDNVIAQMVAFEVGNINGILKVSKVLVEKRTDGAIITLSIVIKYGVKFKEICKLINNNIIKVVDKMTAINVSKVNINIKDIVVEDNK